MLAGSSITFPLEMVQVNTNDSKKRQGGTTTEDLSKSVQNHHPRCMDNEHNFWNHLKGDMAALSRNKKWSKPIFAHIVKHGEGKLSIKCGKCHKLRATSKTWSVAAPSMPCLCPPFCSHSTLTRAGASPSPTFPDPALVSHTGKNFL